MPGCCYKCHNKCQSYSKMVYGILESESNIVLDKEWLSTKYPEMLRLGYGNADERGNAIYGFALTMCEDTGRLSNDTDKKELIRSFYEQLCLFCEKKGYKKPTIGYFIGLAHDLNLSKKKSYIPDN